MSPMNFDNLFEEFQDICADDESKRHYEPFAYPAGAGVPHDLAAQEQGELRLPSSTFEGMYPYIAYPVDPHDNVAFTRSPMLPSGDVFSGNDMPWRDQFAPEDFFNYGFRDETYRAYIAKQIQIRAQLQAKGMEALPQQAPGTSRPMW